MKNQGVPVKGGGSGEPIPVHFAYRRDINVEAVLSSGRKSPIDRPLPQQRRVRSRWAGMDTWNPGSHVVGATACSMRRRAPAATAEKFWPRRDSIACRLVDHTADTPIENSPTAWQLRPGTRKT